jgi:uncharacterized membrane protein YccC
VSMANLSSSFQRMLSEPKSKQGHSRKLHQLIVLNHTLFSNMASVVTTLLSKEKSVYPAELQHTARKALQQLENAAGENAGPRRAEGEARFAPETADDLLMRDQLGYIHRVSEDIARLSREIMGRGDN